MNLVGDQYETWPILARSSYRVRVQDIIAAEATTHGCYSYPPSSLTILPTHLSFPTSSLVRNRPSHETSDFHPKRRTSPPTDHPFDSGTMKMTRCRLDAYGAYGALGCQNISHLFCGCFYFPVSSHKSPRPSRYTPFDQ